MCNITDKVLEIPFTYAAPRLGNSFYLHSTQSNIVWILTAYMWTITDPWAYIIISKHQRGTHFALFSL